MEELTLFDKLLILWDNILDHPLFIVLFFIPILLFFLQKKHGKKVFIISYFLIIFIILLLFGDVIFKLFDNLIDSLFMFLYFPNFISLFFIVICSCLIVLISLFNGNINKFSRVINYITFGIVQSLFALILIIVRVHKINIYKTNSLYTNKDILALMQLLTFVFVVNLISIFIVFIINKITAFLDRRTNFSEKVNEQVGDLAKTKIEYDNFDNNKYGFINVADKQVTSRPKLIPFKFDIEKLQSVVLDVPIISKEYFPFSLDKNDFSYSNEVIPIKLFKPFRVDKNIPFYLKVFNKPYKYISLKNMSATYLNEQIVLKKYKPAFLDSTKFIYLDVPKKDYKLFKLLNDNFSYSNEVIKNYKLTNLDLSKSLYLNIPRKDYKLFDLGEKNVTYLNETIKKPLALNPDKAIELNAPSKGYKVAYVDTSKSAIILSPESLYKKFSLKDKVVSYLNEVVNKKKYDVYDVDLNKKAKYSNEILEEKSLDAKLDADNFTNLETEKHPFDIKPVTEKIEEGFEIDHFDYYKPDIKPILSFPRQVKREVLVENLKIIDMQSMIDVASKYHFMKGVNLCTYSKMTIQNLKVCNFKLLMDILKLYKLCK